MRRLVISSGLSKGQTFDLTQGVTSIGRADENNIVLEDNSISRRHAVLTYDGAEYKLRDVGSSNGTRVNKKPVLETKLVPGDVLQLGEVEIRYETTGQKIVTPPADVEQVKQLQAQLTQLTAQNQELTAKISTAEHQLVEAQKRAAERGAAELTKSDADLIKVRAELDEARKAAAQVTALQLERQALASQLESARKQVEEAAIARSQAQTLAIEKQQLEKQLENANQQLTRERTAAAEREAAIRSELTEKNKALEMQLAGAQKDLNLAWQDIAAARQRITTLEQAGGDAAATQAELTKLRSDLEQAKQAAGRVQELSQERDRLAVEAKTYQDELTKARQQIELAKKETAKIVVTQQPVAAAARADELAEAQTRLKEVSVELTKTKAELEHLRQAAPKAPVVAAPPASSTDRRQELEGRIANLENEIRAAGATDSTEVRQKKTELAVVRANLYNLVMQASRKAGRPAPAPAEADKQPRLAEAPKKKKMALPFLIVLAVAAVAVLAGVVWLYMRWSAPVPQRTAAPKPVIPKIEPAVITEPAPIDKEAEELNYRDPAGRFTCWIPPGWEKEEQTLLKGESRLRLVSGKNVIIVSVSGTDWPTLVKADQPRVEAALFDRLKIMYPTGLYGNLVSTTYRYVEGQPAMVMDASVTLQDGVVTIKSVEYRHGGRAHIIELHERSHDQATLLAATFDKFLDRYHNGRID